MYASRLLCIPEYAYKDAKIYTSPSANQFFLYRKSENAYYTMTKSNFHEQSNFLCFLLTRECEINVGSFGCSQIHS